MKKPGGGTVIFNNGFAHLSNNSSMALLTVLASVFNMSMSRKSSMFPIFVPRFVSLNLAHALFNAFLSFSVSLVILHSLV